MNNYIVYGAFVNDILQYIGSGKPGRERHCNNGISSSKHLNKLYFTSKEKIVVKILHHSLTKEQSIILEKELILKHRPQGNTTYLCDNKQIKGSSRAVLFNKINKDFENCGYKNRILRNMWRDTLKDCIKRYNLIEGIPITIKSTSSLRDDPLTNRIFRIYYSSIKNCKTVKLVPQIHLIYSKYLSLTKIDKIFYLELVDNNSFEKVA